MVRGGLDPVELRVTAFVTHQLIVTADLNKPRAVEHNDEIGHPHGAEPVRYQDGDAADVGVRSRRAAFA